MKSVADVIERAEILKGMNDEDDRARIRAVMNGGALGVQSVLNWSGGYPKNGPGSGKGADSGLGLDLPTANYMHSGMERLAQRVGREPTIKTDMIPTNDTDTARKLAEKRARIVRAWDENDRMELQYPQMGRWLAGYGFTFHTIGERTFGDTEYPVARLRDPYDVYPGMWGPDQQPMEAAVMRSVSRSELTRIYPHVKEKVDARLANQSRGSIPIIGQTSSWEGRKHAPITLVEYYCDEGTHIVVLEAAVRCDFIPNPLESGPTFVMTKRFSFDKLQGQFHHTFGLMAMMGKLNILGLIGVEDSTFRETNIIGEMIGETYERGRMAVNQFEPGTRVEKPSSDQIQQTFAAINTLERQFRVTAGYDVAQDGQSPNSFATGQGIRELGTAANDNVREYQTAIKHSIELIDRKRLEWEDKMHPTKRKKVFWYEGGNHFEETYRADQDINKDYRTNREFGAMATFDENSKIITGLQLMQARVIDRRTFQEQVDGLKNVSLINERIDQDMAKEALIQGLGERMAGQDPAAAMALVEIMDKPSDATKTLKKLFTPQEPEMSPEEAAMAGAGGPGGAEMGPPPAIQTVLAQMEAPGGGVQSVGQMG